MTTEIRETDLLLEALHKLSEATALVSEVVRRRGGLFHLNGIEVDEEFLDSKIESVDFGASTNRIRWMCRSGWLGSASNEPPVETVRELMRFSERDVMLVTNIGRTTLNNMKAVLAAHGLALKTERSR